MSHKTLQQIMLNIIRDFFFIRDVLTVYFPPIVLFSANFSMTALSQWDDPYKENVFCFSMTVFGRTVWKLVNNQLLCFCWEILEHVL